jgi:hypothetical protein
MEANGVARERFVWSYEWASGFVEIQFLDNYLMKMFKQQRRLIPITFHYLCNISASSLGKVDSNMRACILVETWITIALSSLSSGNTFKMCGEVYGMALNIILSL